MNIRKPFALIVALMVVLGVFFSFPTRVAAVPDVHYVEDGYAEAMATLGVPLEDIRGYFEDFKLPKFTAPESLAKQLNQKIENLLLHVLEGAKDLMDEGWFRPEFKTVYDVSITERTVSVHVRIIPMTLNYIPGPTHAAWHYDRKTNKEIDVQKALALNGQPRLEPIDVLESLVMFRNQVSSDWRVSMHLFETLASGNFSAASSLFDHYREPENVVFYFDGESNALRMETNLQPIYSELRMHSIGVPRNRQVDPDDRRNPIHRKLCTALDLSQEKSDRDLLILEVTDLETFDPENHYAMTDYFYSLLTGEVLDPPRRPGESTYGHWEENPRVNGMYKGLEGPSSYYLIVPRDRFAVVGGMEHYENVQNEKTSEPSFPYQIKFFACSIGSTKYDKRIADNTIFLKTADQLREYNLHDPDSLGKDVTRVELKSSTLIKRLTVPPIESLKPLEQEFVIGDQIFRLAAFKQNNKDFAKANKELQALAENIAQALPDLSGDDDCTIYQEGFENETLVSLHNKVSVGKVASIQSYVIDKKSGRLLTTKELLKMYDVKKKDLPGILDQSANYRSLSLPYDQTKDGRFARQPISIDFEALYINAEGQLAATCCLHDLETGHYIYQDFVLILPRAVD